MTFRDVLEQFQKLTPEELDEPFRVFSDGEFYTKVSIDRLDEGESPEDNWLYLHAV